MVVKGGLIAWAQMGDANASIPTPQPVLARPMFGAAIAGRRCRWRSSRRPPWRTVWPIVSRVDPAACCRSANTRGRGKADLPENTATPAIEVDPATFAVRIDGELVVGPTRSSVLPLAQRYCLF